MRAFDAPCLVIEEAQVVMHGAHDPNLLRDLFDAPRDIGASVRARLMNLARERGQVFELLLTRYALERLLYRLSISNHCNRFALKGAMLVTTWFEDPHRPTRDPDLLGFGEPSSDAMLAVWKEICAIEAEDGVTFDCEGLRVRPIREDLEHGGLRLQTTATLAREDTCDGGRRLP